MPVEDKSVLNKFFFTVAIAKGHWKRLRDAFIKKLAEKSIKKSGDGADDNDKPDWSFFDSILFLKDTCMPRETSENFLVQALTQDVSDDTYNLSSEEVDRQEVRSDNVDEMITSDAESSSQFSIGVNCREFSKSAEASPSTSSLAPLKMSWPNRIISKKRSHWRRFIEARARKT